MRIQERYYRAGKRVSELLDSLESYNKNVVRRRRAFAKRLFPREFKSGAVEISRVGHRLLFTWNDWGRLPPVGWRRVYPSSKEIAPRKTSKANRELYMQMRDSKFTLKTPCDVLGFSVWDVERMRGQWYLRVSYNQSPIPGCYRISDVKLEKIIHKHTPRK